MLENTASHLREASPYASTVWGGTGGAGGFGGGSQMGPDFPKLAIPLLRRVMPGLIANELVGVQPMTSPVGLAFALRFLYAAQTTGTYTSDNEAVLNLPTSAVTGFKAPTVGTGGLAGSASEAWATGVGDMSLVIIGQQQISAGTRKLRTSFSLEMAQDIKALHNIDIDDEMTNLLTYEIQAEIEQEIVRTLIEAGSFC